MIKNIAIMHHNEDVKWKNEIETHLAPFQREELISIIKHPQFDLDGILDLDIIIIIVSPRLFGDNKLIKDVDFVLDHQMRGQYIIPILTQKTNLGKHRLSEMQISPRNGKPLEEWTHPSQALAVIAQEIATIAKGKEA